MAEAGRQVCQLELCLSIATDRNDVESGSTDLRRVKRLEKSSLQSHFYLQMWHRFHFRTEYSPEEFLTSNDRHIYVHVWRVREEDWP